MKKQLTIQDTDDLKNIFIQIDVKKGKVIVLSNFSAWENLAFLMEAFVTTAAIFEEEGITKKKIHQAINSYLSQVFSSPILARKRSI